MFPEGESAGRRHAHTECVMQARKAGRLPTRDEYRQAHRAQVAPEVGQAPAWRRLLRRARSAHRSASPGK
jgi:transcription elongation GreA/GreB family factor